MCGIAGMAPLNGADTVSLERLRVMCDTIRHRGPDDEGVEVRGGVALGMRRLAIIDLAGGQQPVYNETGTVRTVFNGEIYNYRELRRELEGLGHIFRTRSDTEVIVHAYEEFGKVFAGRLNGMFAIAIHDLSAQQLLLVRDPIGIKPLYYSFSPERLVWGSEVKALLASNLVKRDLDLDALGEFLAWEYVPGEKTLLQDVKKLRPGHLLDVDLNNPRCRPEEYWDVPREGGGQHLSPGDWEDAVDAKLRECVRRELVSDVPLGAFLSGGVDSSLIAAAMDNPQTFSIGFDDLSYSELEWSQKVARHLGARHETEIIKPNVAAMFEQLMYHMDDPIGDFSIFPTFLVSKLARQHVTVCLSGDGGDELFGGYETYVADEKARQYMRLPAAFRKGMLKPLVRRLKPRDAKKGLINKAKRFVEGLDQPPGLRHARWRIFAGDVMRAGLFSPDALENMNTPTGTHITALFARAEGLSHVDQNLYVDLKSYLVDNILVKVDRMSMAVSLETRVPYLDTELVELAFRMPDELKVAGSSTKVLLKRVAARHVPKECVYRPKEGFSIPIKNWLKTELRELMEDLLRPQQLKAEGVFRADTVATLKGEHLAGVANHSHVLWSLMVFQAWRRRWLEV